MQVYTHIHRLPTFTNAVLTIGTFDGVHLGHQKIIEQLLQTAKEVNGESVLITFHPHPKKIIQQKREPLYLLNTPEEKYELLAKAGVQHVVVVPFTLEFAEQSAHSYIEDFLVNKFSPNTIIIGYDHRFGHNRAGNYKMLEEAGVKFGFSVKEIPEKVLKHVTISSTKIRKALLDGNIEEATSYLGYEYFFEGTVIEGNKMGRTIGYPTANIDNIEPEKLIPGNGVYAVKVIINKNEITLKGMMNIGLRPTVGGNSRHIEVNIFNFNENIYGKNIKVIVVKKIREEVKFPSLEALKGQLGADKNDAEIILNKF